MLAVVDELARFAIRERGGAAAQARARLEHEDSRTACRQTHGGAQAREPGADNHDVVARICRHVRRAAATA